MRIFSAVVLSFQIPIRTELLNGAYIVSYCLDYLEIHEV